MHEHSGAYLKTHTSPPRLEEKRCLQQRKIWAGTFIILSIDSKERKTSIVKRCSRDSEERKTIRLHSLRLTEWTDTTTLQREVLDRMS